MYTRLAGVLLVAIAFILAACGGAQEPTAVPTVVPTQAPTATPAPLALLNSELLGAPSTTIACDHGEGAQINCQTSSGRAQLIVQSNASTFARWALKLGAVDRPLTGNESLLIHARRSGNAMPNLYLVEADGDRIATPLGKYNLGDEWRDIFVPLREIKDENGNAPDFSQIAEIQLVFEWADIDGVVEVDSLRFAPVVEQPAVISDQARTLAAGLAVPAGFAVTPFADDLRNMTQIVFAPDGSMLVTLQEGRVWWYRDLDGDGSFDQRRLYDSGYPELVGLLYDPLDGSVWLGGRGQLIRTLDSDGDGTADVREVRVDGLPWGRHQNNGLVWNPGPDPFTGEPALSWIYFGLGSTEDLEVGGPLNATVLRFPRTGQGVEALEVVSKGNRNAYGVIWAPLPADLNDPSSPRTWQLFASENGPDFNDAPDEVNHIRWGHDYGFPGQFGMVEDPAAEGNPFTSPVYPVTAHTSADGMAYIDHPAWPQEYRTLYVSLFGEVFSPGRVGHTVERIALRTEATPEGTTYRGEPSDFVTGLDRPLPLTTAPDGNLVVGDYATGVAYLVRYAGDALPQ